MKTKPVIALTKGELAMFKRAYNGVVAFLDGSSDSAMFLGHTHMGKAKSVHPHAAYVTIVQFVSEGLWSANLKLSVLKETVLPIDVLRQLQVVTQILPNNQLDRYELSCVVADYFYNLTPNRLERVYSFMKSVPWDESNDLDDEDFYVHEGFARYGDRGSNAWAKLGPAGDLVTTLDEDHGFWKKLRAHREGSLLMRHHSGGRWGLACFSEEDFHEIGLWLSKSRLGHSVDLDDTDVRILWKRPVIDIKIDDN